MPEIRKGHAVEVTWHSKCDFCEKQASYDGRTVFGPWANLCEEHFEQYGVGTGVGYGQRLIYVEPGVKA